MNITYLQNAGERILCDPWLIDGCYYGAWYHYPKFEFNPKEFENIDYIYLSHIHPDHFDVKTLSQLKKDIPVLIHKFPQKYFKQNIEELGFNVEEISHNKRTKLEWAQKIKNHVYNLKNNKDINFDKSEIGFQKNL